MTARATTVLTGNVPVVLDGEATVRVVESGSVAVYCAEVKDGVPAGPRRPLVRLGQGQAVCSVPMGDESGLRFLIVPIQEAVVREIPLAELWNGSTGRETERRPLVDEWVDLLARLLSGHPEPKLPLRVAEERVVALEDGQALCRDRETVIWTRIERGSARLLGASEPVLGPGASLPLGGEMWLEAAGAARIRTATSPTLGDVREVCIVDRKFPPSRREKLQ